LHQIKNVLHSKGNNYQKKRDNPHNRRKSLPAIHETKSMKHKELQKLNTKRIIQLINGQMNWTVLKKKYKWSINA
jgi:hypothetical protein